MKIDNNMSEMLNLAYEIEGLIMLRINRGDESTPGMKQLMVDKTERLLKFMKELEEVVEVPDPVVPAVENTCQSSPADDEAISENAEREEEEDADVEEPTPTVNDSIAQEPQLTLDERLARERAADISKAFTLNDRFRFRRELFRNSDEEFKETLDVIGSMSSMDEAEDYFFNDLCWDPSDDVVKEFMAIVAKHF